MKKLALMMICIMVVRVELVFPQASVSSAELRGQITDPSGAAVAGATITITDVQKGTTRTVTTDDEGNYTFLALLPGIYNLKVEARGFAAKTLNDLRLAVGQVANIPVALGVGGVDAVVNVTATSDVVEVERTQQSSVIGETQIDNLPINRRNYLDFALLTPGVTDADSINDSSDFRVAQTPQSGLSFGGNNGRNNAILVDGASIDTNSGGARTTVGQEAVQEFQVNRNSYNAEFGGASGGVVNIISKTGSNDWRGSIFGYFRDDKFDARNRFDFAPGGGSPFNRQQYGGSLGGPIHKDQTFFFTAAERLDQGLTTFVNLLNDPNIFNITPTQNSLFTFLGATPFAALATGLRGALTTTPQAYPRTVNLFEQSSGQFPFDTDETVFSARVDHTFSENDNAYVRINVADSTFENSAAGALTATSRGRTIDTFTTGGLLSHTHFFSPTTINEAKFQYSYFDLDVIPNDQVGPELNIQGFGFFGRDIFLPSETIERRYEISDNVSLVRGNHTWKLGGQWQAIDNASYSQTFFGGRFDFGEAIPLANVILGAAGQTVFNQLNGFLLSPAGGSFRVDANANARADVLDAPINALQSFNLGLPIVYQQGFGDSASEAFTYRSAVYAQDTWKVRSNLTLNLGVRYFYEDGPFYQPHDRNNIQPRIGFSWDPFGKGKTVIRGGYGIFTGQVDNQIVNVTSELGAFGDPTDINIVIATATSNLLPLNVNNPTGPRLPTSIAIYQTLLAQGVIGNRTIAASDLTQFGIAPGPGRPLEVRFRMDPNFENPYSQQASLAVQQDLGAGFTVEASYLFNRGAHITRNRDVNPFKQTGPVNPITMQPTFIRFPTPAQAAAGLTSDFRNPFIFQDNVYESTANSFYHAGTIQVLKRFSRNFSINSNYTFSKTIDEVTDFNSDFSAQNPLNVRLDRALSAFDQRHRFVFSGVFNSPFDGDSVLDRVLSDWVLSPIFIAGSGRPFNVLLGFDANNDGRSQSDRPGKLGRNAGKGEAFYNMDMRLGRRFSFSEYKYLEFTIDAFNVFNRVNFTGINNVIGTAQFIPGDLRGLERRAPTQPLGFTSAAPARQLQFGARFNF